MFIQDGRWDVGKLMLFFGKELVDLISNIRICQNSVEDIMELKWNLSGKTISALIREEAAVKIVELDPYAWIHKVKLNVKVELFIWRLCKGAIPRADFLMKRKLGKDFMMVKLYFSVLWFSWNYRNKAKHGKSEDSASTIAANAISFVGMDKRSMVLSGYWDAAASREDITSTGTPKHYHSEDIVGNILDSSNKQEPALKPDAGGLLKFEAESENPKVAANYFSTEQKNEVAYNENNKTRRGENISKQPFTTSMLKKPEGHDDSRATNAAQNAIFTTFTPTNISHSVLATENIRLLFTIVMAVLVVSSYNGFMIGGRLLSSIISFRPLLLVLLTDVTIILGWVFLNQGIRQKPEIDARNALPEDEGWPNYVGKILEVGQVIFTVDYAFW
ncbi:hypothetical protein M5K25_021086 [Dendrobium thyrsiflorum]|uniref:Reverse transcriptase zinc-binding domain-containing protein n=1 Tax=Dendrobium thyrsiflorum TaxID=117978 RepID=A0ABD0UBQ9_DENTH